MILDSVTVEQYPKVMQEFIILDKEIKVLQKSIVLFLLENKKPKKREIRKLVINKIYTIFDNHEQKILNLLGEAFEDMIINNESEVIDYFEDKNNTKYMPEIKNEIEKYKTNVKKAFLVNYKKNKQSTAVECYSQIARVLNYTVSDSDINKILKDNNG